MVILWQYEWKEYVWLEWIMGGTKYLKRFTHEGFNKFMDNQEDDLDFLN